MGDTELIQKNIEQKKIQFAKLNEQNDAKPEQKETQSIRLIPLANASEKLLEKIFNLETMFPEVNFEKINFK